jgi:hypothetical protein
VNSRGVVQQFLAGTFEFYFKAGRIIILLIQSKILNLPPKIDPELPQHIYSQVYRNLERHVKQLKIEY